MNISLRTMFILIVGIAVYILIVFELKGSAGYIAITLLNWILLIAIASGVIYGRGTARAFCIGCALVAALSTFSGGGLGFGVVSPWTPAIYPIYEESGDILSGGTRWYFFMQHLTIVLSGLAMVFFRWLWTRNVVRDVSIRSDQTKRTGE